MVRRTYHPAMTIAVGLVSKVIFLPSTWFLQSFFSLPLNPSRRVVSYKQKYVHEVLLVNHLFKLAQKKVGLGEHTILP